MNLIDVLMPTPMHAHLIKGVEERYRLHKLWLESDKQALLDQIKNDIHYILTSAGGMKIDAAFMDQFPKLKAILNFGVGYDAVDIKAAKQKNIVITNTPDVLNEEVADLALGLTLSVIRQIPQADQFLRQGKWEKGSFPLSSSLQGRTMGILGLGRIGKAVAKRAEAFGVRVIYHGRHQQETVGYNYYSDFKEMATASDILLLIAPGTLETHHIVNRDILEALGPTGILINVGRGSLVDEEALIEALEAKKILSAGLDVYEHEPDVPAKLSAFPHVVLLPHVGSASVQTRKAMSQLVIDNLDALASGKEPLTPVL